MSVHLWLFPAPPKKEGSDHILGHLQTSYIDIIYCQETCMSNPLPYSSPMTHLISQFHWTSQPPPGSCYIYNIKLCAWMGIPNRCAIHITRGSLKFRLFLISIPFCFINCQDLYKLKEMQTWNLKASWNCVAA